MKTKCSDHVYYKSKSLKKEEFDLKDKINTFYSHRNDLLRIIIEEKKDDSSEEIHKVEDEVKASNPFKGFINENEFKETNNKEPNNKPCKLEKESAGWKS